MIPSRAEPPRTLCILRLSAIGDTCHVVPVVRTLQQAWPATQLTWIIGKTEARLMSLIEGVEFITVDKSAGLGALAALRRQLRGRRFEALAEHAAGALRMRVILAGGPSELERRTGAEIERACPASLINQIGKDTLPELLALLSRATVLVSPDSGPVHMATAVGTPVVGLYAATNPARSGPYLSGRWCVDAYPRAARAFRGCDPAELPWNHKIEEPGVMDLIGVDEVAAKLDQLLGSRP